jgi:hypothetical protein
VRYLDLDYVLPDDVDDALIRLAAGVAGIREATAKREGASRLVIREEWRPMWTYVVAILLFPIGLVALLIKREALLLADASASAEGTRLRLHGRGHEVVCDGVLATLAAMATKQRVTEQSMVVSSLVDDRRSLGRHRR